MRLQDSEEENTTRGKTQPTLTASDISRESERQARASEC